MKRNADYGRHIDPSDPENRGRALCELRRRARRPDPKSRKGRANDKQWAIRQSRRDG